MKVITGFVVGKQPYVEPQSDSTSHNIYEPCARLCEEMGINPIICPFNDDGSFYRRHISTPTNLSIVIAYVGIPDTEVGAKTQYAVSEKIPTIVIYEREAPLFLTKQKQVIATIPYNKSGRWLNELRVLLLRFVSEMHLDEVVSQGKVPVAYKFEARQYIADTLEPYKNRISDIAPISEDQLVKWYKEQVPQAIVQLTLFNDTPLRSTKSVWDDDLYQEVGERG